MRAHACMRIFQLMTPLDMYLKKLKKYFQIFYKKKLKIIIFKNSKFSIKGGAVGAYFGKGLGFFVEKKWGRIKSVSICNGHLHVSGLSPNTTFIYYWLDSHSSYLSSPLMNYKCHHIAKILEFLKTIYPTFPCFGN